MNNTQSIIVYRSPLEQLFWESGVFLPVIGGLGVILLVLALEMKLLGKIKWPYWSRKRKIAETCAVFLAIICGLGVAVWMMPK